MSLYNLLFGDNSVSTTLLAALGYTTDSIPRYRSVFIDQENKNIVIYTRTGGGNRDFFDCEKSCRENYPEYFKGDNQPKGPWNDDMRKHPLFVRDEDDDFDCTYAKFYFKFPEEFSNELEALVANDPSLTITPSDKWKALFERMS